MSDYTSKYVYISCVKNDMKMAFKLKKVIKDFFNGKIWIKDFDLNAGDLIIDSIDTAISKTKWFFILLSREALKSSWIRMEANLATIRALEDDNFRVVIFKLDREAMQKHLKFAFKNLEVIDLTETSDVEYEFIKIAEKIDKTIDTKRKKEIYVDRGNYEDQFELLYRRNSIIFILGIAGIGKTSFVKTSIPKRIDKHPIIIKLTKGHSMDLLARQILQKVHVEQPMESKNIRISEQHLLELSLEALLKRSDKYFLFIDNGEQGLNPSNQLLPYIERFLERFVKRDINTHVIIATTRYPDYSPNLASSTDILKLGKLDDQYIKECIDLNLEEHPEHDDIVAKPEINDLVQLVSGHPLAAKMVASYLKVKSINQLLNSNRIKRLQLTLAEFILRSADQLILTELHQLFLQILSAINEPVGLEDMLSVKELKKYPIAEIHRVRWELTNFFLIEQSGEMMSLHNFLGAYFHEQIDQGRWNRIAKDFGHYAYDKTIKLNKQLSDKDQTIDKNTVKITNDIFRYCLPAGRFLRSIGEDKLAEELPLKITGTIREMVFYFYQTKKDYKRASDYAERWLRLVPNDTEILLYHARCYRNFRDQESLNKAKKIINRLERLDSGSRLLARIYREKALIAQHDDDIEKAKEYFEKGINAYTPYPYPENHIGLARLILLELDELPYEDDSTYQKAEEAVRLLEEARRNSAVFDRIHLGSYIEALIKAGKTKIALPLLKEALEQKPDDSRLNYRMAELLRKNEQYDYAESYAKNAIDLGAQKAPLTLANILHSRAQELIEMGDNDSAFSKLDEALDSLFKFQPEYGDDQEVADSIAAKIYRAKGEWHKSKEKVFKYEKTKNPYTIYEQCKVRLWEAENAESNSNYGEALLLVNKAISKLVLYESGYKIPEALFEIKKSLEDKKNSLELIINEGNL